MTNRRRGPSMRDTIAALEDQLTHEKRTTTAYFEWLNALDKNEPRQTVKVSETVIAHLAALSRSCGGVVRFEVDGTMLAPELVDDVLSAWARDLSAECRDTAAKIAALRDEACRPTEESLDDAMAGMARAMERGRMRGAA